MNITVTILESAVVVPKIGIPGKNSKKGFLEKTLTLFEISFISNFNIFFYLFFPKNDKINLKKKIKKHCTFSKISVVVDNLQR